MKKIIVLIPLISCLMSFAVGAPQKNTYKIFIDAELCRLYLLCNDELVKTYPCAVGKYSTPSPIGNWIINHKAHWGEGFGGNFLGINCPWGKFGIHGTSHPESIGWCASGGCIRMYNKDIAELYGIIPYNTPVIIEDGCFGVFGKGFREITPDMYGSDLMAIQKRLADLGYSVGSADGKYGKSTRSAIHQYQKDNGFPVDDNISVELIKSMGFVLME